MIGQANEEWGKRMKNAINLKPVWDAILDIYREVAGICDRHGLRYYLTDGTALGAVRHQGFIPWDDDFDMSMPREDYEKFLKIAPQELPGHLKFVNWENTPEFMLLFGKVQDSRQEVVAKVEAECGYLLSSGIYIDIIPIDGYPESSFERFWVQWYVRILSCMIRFRCMRLKDQSKKGRLVWLAGLFFSILLPWKDGQSCKRTCESFLLRHSFAAAHFVGRASMRLTMLNRKPMPVEYWGEPTWGKFNDIDVPLPHDIDAYLKFYYGDYMKLPPESQRHHSHGYTYRCAWWLGPTKV
jgi:lipopolysaccharide cholinephosphotransferase